jgi:hypothetical protein
MDFIPGVGLRLCYVVAVGGLGTGVQQVVYVDSTDFGQTYGTEVTINATGNVQPAPLICHTDKFWCIIYFDGTNLLQSRNYYGPMPVIPIIDSFNRADENPLSDNGNWVIGGLSSGLTTAPKLVSNTIQRKLASGSFGRDGVYRGDIQFPANRDCIVAIKISTAGTDSEFDITLSDVVAHQGNSLFILMGSFGTGVSLSTDATANIAPQTSRSVTSTDKYALWIHGADVVSLIDIGSGWVENQRAQNTSRRTAFRPAIESAGFSDTTVALADDFAAGLTDAIQQHLDQSRYPKSNLAGVT